MPIKNQPRAPQNGYETLSFRVTLLEQGLSRLERVYAYVFGSDDPEEESIKSQMKNMNTKIDDLASEWHTWKTTQEKTEDDRAKDKNVEMRRYVFLFVSTLLSLLSGVLLARFVR